MTHNITGTIWKVVKGAKDWDIYFRGAINGKSEENFSLLLENKNMNKLFSDKMVDIKISNVSTSNVAGMIALGSDNLLLTSLSSITLLANDLIPKKYADSDMEKKAKLLSFTLKGTKVIVSAVPVKDTLSAEAFMGVIIKLEIRD